MKLSINVFELFDSGDKRTPAQVVRALGILYERFEAQPIADRCVFHGCTNLPAELPAYIDTEEED